VQRGSELHLRAIRLQEEHARHAREHGDEVTASLADERAERARQRFIRTLGYERGTDRNGHQGA
jgi:hypothetical protein